jgi:putative transposase
MLMQPVTFKRHSFPTGVIRLAVWLNFRFSLGFRDVEAMLAYRGIQVSYETVRSRTLQFGRAFARNLRKSRPKPTGRRQTFKSQPSAQRFLATHAAA